MKINSVYSYDLSGSNNMRKDIKKQYQMPYTGEDLKDDNAEQKKGKFSVKKATNMAAVAAWLLVAALGIYRTGIFRPKSTKGIANKAEKYGKKAKFEIEKRTNTEKPETTLKPIPKFLYKIGDFFSNMKQKMGKELFNNFTYAIGTLFVMPLVIWTSPFGKKDSSTSDKAYATLRQPFSVAATFTLQAMFDKLLDKFMPKIIKDNIFEDEKVKNANLKNIEFDKETNKLKNNMNEKEAVSLFEKIKYNADEAKRIFRDVLPNIDPGKGGLKGIISTDLAKMLTDKNEFADEELETYQKMLEDFKGKHKNISDANFKVIENRHKFVQNSVAYQDLLKTRTKVITNVVVSSVIGCTVLNVIYGKTMKVMQSYFDKKHAQKTEGGKETV